MAQALIIAGSNLDRENNLPRAIALVRHHAAIVLRAVSPIYETGSGAALRGPQSAFYDLALLIETDLSPEALRHALREIEDVAGPRAGQRVAAPIPIDLDIALYGQEVIESDGHRIPDPDILRCPARCRAAGRRGPRLGASGTGQTLREIADSQHYTDKELRRVMDTRIAFVVPDSHYATDIDARAGEVYDPHFESLVEQMLVRLGEDPEREGLRRTPLRVAKAMDFLTSGYNVSLDDVVNDAIFEDCCQEMVIVKDIEFYSLCEHHMLPFFGKAHRGLRSERQDHRAEQGGAAGGHVARRLQVQERLTNQIADAMMEILTPHGVGVVLEASHFCMMMRGVEKQNSSTVTSAVRGSFQDHPRAGRVPPI